MSWLRHPPHPAERLGQRLGFATWRAEYLYSRLKRRYLWLWWPGVFVGILVCVCWWLALHGLMPLILGGHTDFGQAPLWRTLTVLFYYLGLSLCGGLYIGSLAEWRTNDRSIRRFIVEFIDTPKCFACDYGLTGVPRGADGELRCPECTQNWPWHNRIRDPRPHMSSIDPPRQPDVRPSTGSGTAVANRHGSGQSHTPPPR